MMRLLLSSSGLRAVMGSASCADTAPVSLQTACHLPHAVVEVALDLDGLGAVVHRLAEHCRTRFARADERRMHFRPQLWAYSATDADVLRRRSARARGRADYSTRG